MHEGGVFVSIIHTARHIAASTGPQSHIYVFDLTWVGYGCWRFVLGSAGCHIAWMRRLGDTKNERFVGKGNFVLF